VRQWSTIIILLPYIVVAANAATELGVKDTQFTLNGKPKFLLGISYYGALGAPQESIKQDLDDMESCGLNWLRVWATWGDGITAVDKKGQPQQPYWDKLKWLVAECDRRGMVVDVTLSRGLAGLVESFEAHRRAVEALVTHLKLHRNWYLDLANERNIRDARFVDFNELQTLRDTVRRLDPKRLVTASQGGDISLDELREYLLTVRLDFVCPHRPRDADSPKQTQVKTQKYLAWIKDIGRIVPVHYQEPFRRGYQPEHWEPPAEAFLTDLRQAIAGGAAGWCFHNGGQRNVPGGNPHRSFDMRQRRLFEQLDDQERKFLKEMRKEVVDD
jgi:endo-1,4-beta-mannosidase